MILFRLCRADPEIDNERVVAALDTGLRSPHQGAHLARSFGAGPPVGPFDRPKVHLLDRTRKGCPRRRSELHGKTGSEVFPQTAKEHASLLSLVEGAQRPSARYSPRKTGFRFSRNAVNPSTRSLVSRTLSPPCSSTFKPSSMPSYSPATMARSTHPTATGGR